MNQLLYNYVGQGRNDQPHAINVNFTVFDQQSTLNYQTSIDPEIPFNIFINGIKEQIFAQKIQAYCEETIEYQLGNGSNLSQNDSKTLQTLGFTNNCILYVRIKGKGGGACYSNQLYKQNYEPNPVIIVNVSVHYQHAQLILKSNIDPEIPFNVFVNGIKEQIVSERILAQYEETIEWKLGQNNIQQDETRTLRSLGFTNNCTLHANINDSGQRRQFKQSEKRKYKVIVDLQSEKMELFIVQFETNPISCIFHDILIELLNNKQLKIDRPFNFFINETEIEPFDIRQIKDFNTNKGIIVKIILPNKQSNQDLIEKFKFAQNSSKQIKHNLRKIIKISYNNKMEMFAENDTSLEDILQKMYKDLKISNINQNNAKKYYINDVELFELNNVYPIDNIKVDIFQYLNQNDIILKIIGDFNKQIKIKCFIHSNVSNNYYQIEELKSMNTSMTEFLQYLKFKIFGPNQINYKQDIFTLTDDWVDIHYQQIRN